MPTRAMCKVDVREEEEEEEEFKDVREKEEEQGSYAMEDLEEALPIRRGLSRFYNGKSRSFANLADALKIKDIQELAKPDYFHIYKMRKPRKNTLAPRLDGGAISKRPTTSATNLALAMAMSNSESECNSPCNYV
ncbi:protein OXIDATIVE STRESS 3 LIKE 2-like [Salvia hispanica]|uniref:protein OXIDATIVE STRESS 3 LIKE 2-like n=1 Tax=Salvia hispanica TaxID=49212 RepID=UPI0020093FE8|nr:protein OXIDATIVE STRESS 3 LIKE 2-like [Salvia hispanica]